ncbi:MAG: hypothetical protein LLG02_11860 [Pelosinus sp.]|nr:hypothetical protein [Pelosinus sp.]
MLKKMARLVMMVSLFAFVVTLAGCSGGGQTVQRIAGLSPEDVVKTFVDAAKNNRLSEAALYVAATSKSNPQTVLKYVTGQTDVQQLKDANLLLVKQVVVQGDYAVVAVGLKADSYQVKAVGLEKVAGEWYIVDFDQILNNAKYNILRGLLSNI